MAAMRWQHARLEKYSAMHRCRSTVTALACACSTTSSFAPARTAARTTGRSRIDTDRIIVRWSDGLSELEDWEIGRLGDYGVTGCRRADAGSGAATAATGGSRDMHAQPDARNGAS